MGTILRVFKYLRRYPWMAVGTLACAILGTVMVIVFPTITQLVIDVVIRQNRPELLMPLILIGAGAFFAQDVLNCLRIILNNAFEQKVIFDLRSDLYAHIQRLPLGWFDNRATGDLMTRIIDDVNSVERVLIDGIEQGVVAVLQVVIVCAVLFAYNTTLSLWALAPVPLLAAGALWYTTTAKGRYRKQRRAASALNSLLHDNIAGIRQIKAYVREESEHGRFNVASRDLQRTTLGVMFAWALYSPAMSFFASLGLVLVVAFGGADVLAGRMQIGELVAFITLVRFLYEPIGRLHQLNQLFQAGRAAGERVFEILDEPVEPEGEERVDVPLSLRGEVEFRNVCFSYGADRPTLTNVSLLAQPGNRIALVGPTGAGKTTLVNLIARFYEHTSGELLVDGRPIGEYPRRLLRAQIGVVTQESFLFNGTIRQNLLFGRPDASDAEINVALRSANAWEFVSNLPNGLESIVGERGVKLSVGEKQRLSIARALLKNPPILILDEATASVDTQTERLIQEALDHLIVGRTSFVIAHRLSTVRNADMILVLSHGQIVERGAHEELLSLGGLYARLWEHSFIEERASAIA